MVFPAHTLAAEVLQVRGPKVLQIGDRNRSFMVKLACVEIEPKDEKATIELLKTMLRRHKKVNLRPQSSSDGILLARVISLDENVDLSQVLYDQGLASLTC